jgi:hypothetical protein
MLHDLPRLSIRLERINGLDFTKNIALSIVGISVFTLVFVSTGTAILRLFRVEKDQEQSDSMLDLLAYLGTAFLVGSGSFSLIFMTLALQGWLKPSLTATILLMGFLTGIGKIKKGFLDQRKAESIAKKYQSNRDRLLLTLGMTIIFLTLFYSSARLSYDSVAVYYSDAKITAMTGQLQHFTNDSFAVSIFHTAIQFSAISQLFGDQAARLFSWVNGLVVIIFSLAIAKKVGLSKPAQIHLFLFLATSTAFIDLMGDGKVELASFSPAIAAIYWIIIENRYGTSCKPLLFLIGFLTGLTMVARPYNVPLVGGFILLYYIQNISSEKWKKAFQSYKRTKDLLIWIGMGSFGIGIYHLAANWVFLGSPLAMVSNAMNIAPAQWQWSINPKQLFLIRVLYPFAVTYMNTTQSLGTISPLFVGVLPTLINRNIRRQTVISQDLYTLVMISMVILLGWVFLFFTVMEIRYTFFLWIFLFMPLSEIMAGILENRTGIIRHTIVGGIILLLAFIALRTMYISLDTYSPIDKRGNPQCRDSRFCEHLVPINETAHPGDRVLTLSAFRYYLRNDLFACSTRKNEYESLRELASLNPELFWEETYRLGYKYIAYENDYTTRHLQFPIIPSPDNVPEWIELEPIFGKPGNLQVSYKIIILDSPGMPETKCEKNSAGIWEILPVIP